jgi:hypothetical protein
MSSDGVILQHRTKLIAHLIVDRSDNLLIGRCVALASDRTGSNLGCLSPTGDFKQLTRDRSKPFRRECTSGSGLFLGRRYDLLSLAGAELGIGQGLSVFEAGLVVGNVVGAFQLRPPVFRISSGASLRLPIKLSRLSATISLILSQIIKPPGVRLNLPSFNQMNHISDRRVDRDRYTDLPPQLRNIPVDEVDFRSFPSLEVL